jgi:hypothetical protein
MEVFLFLFELTDFKVRLGSFLGGVRSRMIYDMELFQKRFISPNVKEYLGF